MNWSDYSRFVGDVFGAPLAIEGLLAFFLESTFLGLWIFGWDKLPRGLHAACMWIVHLGTLFSAYFILAANSWMQHPVGYGYNPDTGRAELTDFGAVMFNKVQLVTFPHVILAAYMTGGAFVLGVAAWLYVQTRHEADRPMYRTRDPHRRGRHPGRRPRCRGHRRHPGQDHDRGPADEDGGRRGALRDRARAARRSRSSPSAPSTGRRRSSRSRSRACCPSSAPAPSTARSRASTTCASSTTRRTARTRARRTTPPGDYTPDHPGDLLVVPLHDRASASSPRPAPRSLLWLTRRGRAPGVALARRGSALGLPVATRSRNSFGWIFTEMGRQPWVVFGLMTTENGVSPGVSAARGATSLIVAHPRCTPCWPSSRSGCCSRYVRKGADPFEEPPDPTPRGGADEDAPLAFAY